MRVIERLWLIWAMALVPMTPICHVFWAPGLPEAAHIMGKWQRLARILIGPPHPGEPAKWQVVLASNASCLPCQTFGEGMEKFHTALGRERNRVVVSEVQTMTLTVSEPYIWVIDPLGNVVLKFEPGINPTLILQDLKKLLKLSKVG